MRESQELTIGECYWYNNCYFDDADIRSTTSCYYSGSNLAQKYRCRQQDNDEGISERMSFQTLVFKRIRNHWGMRCAEGYKLKEGFAGLGSQENPCEEDKDAIIAAAKDAERTKIAAEMGLKGEELEAKIEKTHEQKLKWAAVNYATALSDWETVGDNSDNISDGGPQSASDTNRWHRGAVDPTDSFYGFRHAQWVDRAKLAEMSKASPGDNMGFSAYQQSVMTSVKKKAFQQKKLPTCDGCPRHRLFFVAAMHIWLLSPDPTDSAHAVANKDALRGSGLHNMVFADFARSERLSKVVIDRQLTRGSAECFIEAQLKGEIHTGKCSDAAMGGVRPSAKPTVVAKQLRRLASMNEEEFRKQGFPSSVGLQEFKDLVSTHGSSDEQLAEVATLANEEAFRIFTEAKSNAQRKDDKDRLAQQQLQQNAKVAGIFTAASVTSTAISGEQAVEKTVTAIKSVIKSAGIGKTLTKMAKGFGEYLDDLSELDSGFDMAVTPNYGANTKAVTLSEGFGMALASIAWVCSVVSLVQTMMDEDVSAIEKAVSFVQFGLGTAGLVVSIIGAVASQAATASAMQAVSGILGPITSLIGGTFQLYKGYRDLHTYGAESRGVVRLVAGVAMIGSAAMGILMAAGVCASTGIGLIVSVALLVISVAALVATSFMKGAIQPEQPAPGDDTSTIENAIRWGLLREKVVVGVPVGIGLVADDQSAPRGNVFSKCGKIPANIAVPGGWGGGGVDSYRECINLHTSIVEDVYLKIDAHTQVRSTSTHYVYNLVVGDRVVVTKPMTPKVFRGISETIQPGTFGIISARVRDRISVLIEIVRPNSTATMEMPPSSGPGKRMLMVKKEFYPPISNTAAGWEGYISRRAGNVGGRGDRMYATTCLATPRVMNLLTFVMGPGSTCRPLSPYPKLPYNQDVAVHHAVPYYVTDASVDFNQIADAEKSGRLPRPSAGMSPSQKDLSETARELFNLRDPQELMSGKGVKLFACKDGFCSRKCQGAPSHAGATWWCWTGYEGVSKTCKKDSECSFAMPCTSKCGGKCSY